MTADSTEPSGEFGPSGYLPERAAKRARKIVLREQMGMQWPIAAVVAALLVLVAGGIFLVTGTGPPDAPFAPVADIASVDPRGAALVSPDAAPAGALGPAEDVVVVRAGGGVRVFLSPINATDATDAIGWCPASGRLESADGRVWNANGRLIGGTGESLRALPAQVHDGVLYVDVTTPGRPVPTDPAGETPACSP